MPLHTYTTYSHYTACGGLLSEAQYALYAPAAAAEITRRIFGRAVPAEMQPNVAACECALVDALYAWAEAPRGVKSVSNDGYTVHYAHSARTQAADVARICRLYLCHPHNLMHAGKHWRV